MSARAAEVKVFDRRTIPSPAWNWSHEEDLVQTHFRVVNTPFAEAKDLLQIERCQNLTVQNRIFETRCVVLDHVHDRISQGVPLSVPAAIAQMIGGVLHPDRHYMFAGRSERRIGHRRNSDLQKRLSREAAVLRVIRRVFKVIDCWPDMNDAAQSGGRRLTLC